MIAKNKRRERFRVTHWEICEPRILMSAASAVSFQADYYVETQATATTSASTAASGTNAAAQVRADYGFTGQGQTVVVIDTGIAYDHPDLGGGYGPGYRVVGGYDFSGTAANNPFDFGPMGGHGTAVAGIIGGSDPQHLGVAPGVDFVSLRVFDNNGNGSLNWVSEALQWVDANRNSFEYPITTVNLSLGITSNSTSPPAGAMFETELAKLDADGIFVAAAAGNSFSTYNTPGVTYPASSPYVVPVMSTNAAGNLSSFSQRDSLAIAAPGENILCAAPDYDGNHNGKDDDYVSYSGTSMASPYVAGAAVLIRQAYWATGVKNVTETMIYQDMINTADTIYDSATGQDYHRLNLVRAVSTIMGGSAVSAQLDAPALYNAASGAFSLPGGTTTAVATTQAVSSTNSAQCITITGDWFGTGVKTVGEYDPTTGTFVLRGSDAADATGVTFSFGPANSNWIPIAGDWNGDGIDTVGLYNPATSTFYLRNSNSSGAANTTFCFGAAHAGWTPIAGDWNGDGKDTVGLYDPATATFYLRNSNTTGTANVTFAYGAANSNWVPVAGDWNGSGVTTVGLYAPGSSTFYLRNSNTSGVANATIRLTAGGAGWTPVIGAWIGSAPSASTAATAPLSTTPTRLSIDEPTSAPVGWWLAPQSQSGSPAVLDGYFAANGENAPPNFTAVDPTTLATQPGEIDPRAVDNTDLHSLAIDTIQPDDSVDSLDWSSLSGGPAGATDLPDGLLPTDAVFAAEEAIG